jgi:vacuolar-type H+-ATPase subunit E/Vma4
LGHRELIESLRREGEETINRLWSEIKAEAGKINAEASRRIEELREKYGKIREIEVNKQEDSILSEANNRARIIKLSAEKVLSERLFPLALSYLLELRNDGYKDVFASLIKELPDVTWKDVRVNPQDTEIAREHFPDSNIIPDDNISGGLEVLREDGKICIADTFEKRLDKAWEDILPLLINEIYKEASGNGPSSKS